MTELHQILGIVTGVGSAILVVASVWSWLAARRSAGERDHRLAVDRAILFVVAAVGAAAVLGLVMLVTGSRPADALHLLYGVAAIATPLVGWWLAARRADDGGASARRRPRRDGFLVIASLILAGVIVRLFMTG
jgi:cytochrome bd-type quinol oxidase subunit 2